jgi:hypothetical protein
MRSRTVARDPMPIVSARRQASPAEGWRRC